MRLKQQRTCNKVATTKGVKMVGLCGTKSEKLKTTPKATNARLSKWFPTLDVAHRTGKCFQGGGQFRLLTQFMFAHVGHGFRICQKLGGQIHCNDSCCHWLRCGPICVLQSTIYNTQHSASATISIRTIDVSMYSLNAQ